MNPHLKKKRKRKIKKERKRIKKRGQFMDDSITFRAMGNSASHPCLDTLRRFRNESRKMSRETRET